LAKRAELVGDTKQAIAHVADAAKLTREPGDQMQLERWLTRLDEKLRPLLVSRPPLPKTLQPLPNQKDFLQEIAPRKRGRPRKPQINTNP
jgi:hypothetical protein